jgi:hypothetical protein
MSNGRHVPITAEAVGTGKTPRITEKVEGSYNRYPSWRFSRADIDHSKWSVLDQHEDIVLDPSDPGGTSVIHQFSKSIDRKLLDHLKSRENMLWKGLMTQSGGRKSGTNSHNIPIHNLIKEARDRITELNIDADELMSVRLTGTERVFGILEEGVLDIIWFDRNHEICPSFKT